MEKDKFIKYINNMASAIGESSKNSKLFSKIFNGSSANYFIENKLIDDMIEILTDVMGDEDGWIEYFCYELDFGKENYRLKAYDKDDNEIPLANAKDLYNLLNDDKDDE